MRDPMVKSLPVYRSFNAAKQQLAGIEAIDYFFAQQIAENFDPDEQSQFFHLLIALSESLRNGHTCLSINTRAGQSFGFACDEQGIVSHHGYVFAQFTSLDTLLSALNIRPEHNHAIVYHRQNLYLRRYFQFEQELEQFIGKKEVIAQDNHGENTTRKMYSEQAIADCIKRLFPTQEQLHQHAPPDGDIDWQKIAVANAINKDFYIIAGGPGTGKTYTVTKLLAALVMLSNRQAEQLGVHTDKSKLRFALVAPTGKAAQRLSESIIAAVDGFRGLIDDAVLVQIPNQAKTIHRLLGVIPNSPNFRHHQENPLEIDVLLIDEVSMVDLAMMARIFRALPHHCKVVLLGDADQLPSVAAGSVLADLAPRPHKGYSADNLKYLKNTTGIQLPKIHQNTDNISVDSRSKVSASDHVTFLIKSRRFDGEGGIGKIAKAVISGAAKSSWLLLNQSTSHEQLTLLSGDVITWLAPLVSQYYQPLSSCAELDAAFMQLAKFRVLCATRKGEQGVEHLNEKIKQLLIAKGCIPAHQTIYHGQPIMINENNYRLGLYNGDIGLMWRNETGHLMAVFEGSEQAYQWIMPSRLPQYETVYAMTIHKTQGSEFDHVAMILPKQTENRLLSRELLYTGITRAKKHLSISSTANVWQQAIECQIQRHSGFSFDVV